MDARRAVQPVRRVRVHRPDPPRSLWISSHRVGLRPVRPRVPRSGDDRGCVLEVLRRYLPAAGQRLSRPPDRCPHDPGRAVAIRRRPDRCNLCGASAFTVLTHRDRYGFPVTASACDRCGLVFLDPVMTAAAYSRFYAGTYRPLVSAYHGRLIDAHTIQGEQWQYAADLIGATCAARPRSPS